AAINYIHTKDKKKAIQVAVVQSARTFGTTLLIYTATQQVHRITAVRGALEVVQINNLSPSMRRVIMNGLGKDSIAGANKALCGTLVTSAVLIAITTGPDLIKVIRGRVSGAQFLKNASV